ncbi:hypothetical protein KIN20_033475 [Parelaphostrongylus tenuis]|nr:hypothetical protein KIN20_033475 [Parelaphostrongylus tenuis]
MADFARLLEVAETEASLDYPEAENDQIRALDTLAAYYVRLGHKERTSKEKKRDLFSEATLLYTRADQLGMYALPHLTGRAYLSLVEAQASKFDQAEQELNLVLDQNLDDIPALMCKAIIFFSKQNYKAALSFLKYALRRKPDGPADMRVGIGYCLARLGLTDKARIAFERTLELRNDNVCALSALAILDYNKHTAEGVQSGFARLSQAYDLEPENPVVLVHLANYYFFKGEMEKVEPLAWHAMKWTESDEVKAVASFQLARYFHYNREYEKAFNYYYLATTYNYPTFVLPYYGLGQYYIMHGGYMQAITAFETVLKFMPNDYDTMKVLGSLYAHTVSSNAGRQEKAREMLEKVLEMNPNDMMVLFDLAQLFERVDPQEALSYYERTCQLIKSTENGQLDVLATVLNNMGTLCMTMKKYDRAKEYFEAAVANLQKDLERDLCDSKFSSYIITMRYNLARCLEHLCLFEDAEVLYKAILQEQENYTDCYNRLGCLARDRGQIYESSVWFKEALSVDPKNADSWVLIGNLHMSKHEWGPGRKKFEHVLCRIDIEDVYSLVSLGNYWMEILFDLDGTKADNPGQKRKCMHQALRMFEKALKIEPRNMWAANGIGCVLASKSLWEEALNIFSQIREATSEFYDACMNTAHAYTELGQYAVALQMYSSTIKKFSKEQDHEALIYLARAYYKAGRFSDSRHTLEKAMIEAPDSILLKFNYAFILKLMATEVLQDVMSSALQLRGAMADLRTTERMLTFISSARNDTCGGSRFVSRTLAGEEARACTDLLKQAQTYLAKAQQKDEEYERQRAKQQAEREALQRKLAQEVEEREQELREKEALRTEMRNDYVQMTKHLLRMPELCGRKN